MCEDGVLCLYFPYELLPYLGVFLFLYYEFTLGLEFEACFA